MCSFLQQLKSATTVLLKIPYGETFAGSYHDSMPAPPNGIDERAFAFLRDAIRFVRTVRPEPGVRRLIDQLVASAGSIAANRQEAAGASSRREFIRFNEIALRSANESVLWLRVFDAVCVGDPATGPALLGEARQLARIIGAIVVRAKTSAAPKGPI